MAAVTLERLTKVYDGGAVAVKELDLEIRDGEFLVLVGPSGCGKSTTLRMIAGLEAPTSGRIRIGARDVTDAAPGERDIAMVFQNYALYPHMTVRENLAFGLRVRKTPKAEVERRVREVAATLGLSELLGRRPAALSGGQRQRVALGRAIVREPSVFLFDEPLSNLDAKLRVHTRAELVRLHRELGTTMVYVTHDQVEALTMGQRIAVLHAGELQQLAPPLDVYDRPANLTVAAFIGSPPMNFFPGRLDADGLAAWFTGASFRLEVPPPERAATDVVLGVRPEHVALSTAEEHDDLRAAVQVVETLGSETLIYCRTARGEDVAVRTTARPALRPDDVVGLRFDRTRLHLFAQGTGERVGP
ncbi:MAG TPA: sn-glycerol-3-phosphate ABC transporter ATP-binding protein UgpC [Longimicrobiales bacterium]